MYSSAVLKYSFEVLEYFNFLLLLLRYNSGADIVLFTLLHLFDGYKLQFQIINMKYNQ